ncbi:hypothetical protein CYMTET_45124 [Cymbomonas tetramitiformis]|uniref:Uncharacterized protein n=1 Tax=Cymbomonas tetramitiformis TaxID=36881 RepID=A0AAE0C052_9CHLO|nr:hypothetical protein CYMTET_45124 [Cymbomonas tetramitiformis]
MPSDASAGILAATRPDIGAMVAAMMKPVDAGKLLEAMPTSSAGLLLATMVAKVAAAAMQTIDVDKRSEILGSMSKSASEAISMSLRGQLDEETASHMFGDRHTQKDGTSGRTSREALETRSEHSAGSLGTTPSLELIDSGAKPHSSTKKNVKSKLRGSGLVEVDNAEFGGAKARSKRREEEDLATAADVARRSSNDAQELLQPLLTSAATSSAKEQAMSPSAAVRRDGWGTDEAAPARGRSGEPLLEHTSSPREQHMESAFQSPPQTAPPRVDSGPASEAEDGRGASFAERPEFVEIMNRGQAEVVLKLPHRITVQPPLSDAAKAGLTQPEDRIAVVVHQLGMPVRDWLWAGDDVPQPVPVNNGFQCEVVGCTFGGRHEPMDFMLWVARKVSKSTGRVRTTWRACLSEHWPVDPRTQPELLMAQIDLEAKVEPIGPQALWDRICAKLLPDQPSVAIDGPLHTGLKEPHLMAELLRLYSTLKPMSVDPSTQSRSKKSRASKSRTKESS